MAKREERVVASDVLEPSRAVRTLEHFSGPPGLAHEDVDAASVLERGQPAGRSGEGSLTSSMSATGRPLRTRAMRTALLLGRRSGRPSAAARRYRRGHRRERRAGRCRTASCGPPAAGSPQRRDRSPAWRIRRGTNGASTVDEAAHTAIPTSPDVIDVEMPCCVVSSWTIVRASRPLSGHSTRAIAPIASVLGEQDVPEQPEAAGRQRHQRDDTEDGETEPLQRAVHDAIHRRRKTVDEIREVTFERQHLALRCRRATASPRQR